MTILGPAAWANPKDSHTFDLNIAKAESSKIRDRTSNFISRFQDICQATSFSSLESFSHLGSLKISIRSLAVASVLSFPIIQLNIYFAWTSHVGEAVTKGFSFYGNGSSPLRSFLVSEVNDIAKLQLGIPAISSFFTNLASRSGGYSGGGFFGGGYYGGFFGGGGFLFFGSAYSLVEKYFIDTEVIVFVLAVFFISLLLFQKKGIGVSVLRAFEITSLTILPLGLEIFYFDRSEFNMHASDIQVLAGLAWFTNADVLYLSSAILVITLFIELLRYAKRMSAGNVPSLLYSERKLT